MTERQELKVGKGVSDDRSGFSVEVPGLTTERANRLIDLLEVLGYEIELWGYGEEDFVRDREVPLTPPKPKTDPEREKLLKEGYEEVSGEMRECL